MVVAAGKSILNRIGIGKIRIYRAPCHAISDRTVQDPEAEEKRFDEALRKASDHEERLYEKAKAEVGEENAAIFEAHRMMLEDEDLQEMAREIIRNRKKSAEYAAGAAFDHYAQAFADLEDPYMQARSADLTDLKNIVLDILTGSDPGSIQGTEPCILVAEDLTPSETVRLDKSLLLGIITREGSANSHTAILARSMNLPALIQCREIDESWDGRMGILDGYRGCVYIDPDPDLLERMQGKYDAGLREDAQLQALRGKPCTTLDGRRILVAANISGPADLDSVLKNDAEGVGLFRSEFLYLGSGEEPTEEEQFRAYRQVVRALAPALVVVRTCDIGADKTVGYLNLEEEANPSLGFRAIRICLTRKDFFKKQLRAMLRAAAYGNMGIMFPMITSVWEVREAKAILEECREELRREGHRIGTCQTGIMVETPAAVLEADALAQEVDFFSLGTNDLLQYICAIDRQNEKLERFTDLHHPALLRAIKMTVDAGHRHGIWVGICGELGADPTMTETFLRMGVDELSVNAGSVLPLRRIIRSLDLSGATDWSP